MRCRQRLQSLQLMKRIPDDLAWVFDVSVEEQLEAAVTGSLWDDEYGMVSGGKNYGDAQ